jgi:oxygen-dependent protoporphyrinogen oxidase
VKRIVVVGAGISGLTLARRLEQRLGADAQVQVLESSGRVGGTAWTQRAAGYCLESGPNGFLDSRTAIVDLCRELGLENELIRANPTARRRFLFLGDRLRPLPTNPVALLATSLLSLRGKCRVFCEPWVRPADVEDESIFEFGRRRIGPEAAETFLDAAATGIFAGDSSFLSVQSCFPRLAAMEREHGSLFRAIVRARRTSGREDDKAEPARSSHRSFGVLTTLRGGMGSLVVRLAENLRGPVALNSSIQRIVPAGNQWRIVGEGLEILADAVAMACPASEQARMLGAAHADLAAEIEAIPYNSLAVCVLGYSTDDLPRVPNGFGYISPHRLGRPVLGVVFSSAIFPQQSPTNHFQFRAILGGWNRAETVERGDAEIVQTVRDDLRTTLGVEAPPSFDWVCRWPRAIPQYAVGHQGRIKRIERMQASLPGLFLTGNAYRGVSLADCVSSSNELAPIIAEYISREKNRSENRLR